MRDTSPPRTLLEQLVQNADRTLPEFCLAFEAHAAEIGENFSVSPRQLSRWMAGHVDSARPVARRVAESFLGVSFKELMGPAKRGSRSELPVRPSSQPSFSEPDTFEADSEDMSEEFAMAARESARFVKYGANLTTPEIVDQLDSDIHWLAGECLRQPPYAAFRLLARLRREVFELIDGRPRPEHLRRLYIAAGQLSAMLAHVSSDLGHAYAAGSHARMAWMCADMASEDSLRSYIRWVQAQVAYWQGEYAKSAALAQDGQTYARNGSDLLRATCQQARSLAATREVEKVDRALAAAAEHRESAAAEPEPPGILNFPVGKAAYYAAEAWITLGGQVNLRRAVAEAGNALMLLQNSSAPELKAAAGLDLTAARVGLNEIEGAQESIREVIGLPSESRTLPIIKRMGEIRTSLELPPFADNTVARDLRDQAELFCAYPAMRELPEFGS